MILTLQSRVDAFTLVLLWHYSKSGIGPGLGPDPSLALHLKVQKTNCPEDCVAWACPVLVVVLAWTSYSLPNCYVPRFLSEKLDFNKLKARSSLS